MVSSAKKVSLSLDSVSSSSRFVIRPLLATSSKSRINYQPSCKDNSCWYDYELVNGPCSNDIGNVADTRGRHPPYIITQLHAASFLAASFRDARVCARAIRSGERSRFCPIKRRPWNADDRTHNRGKLKLGMYNRNTVYNRP